MRNPAQAQVNVKGSYVPVNSYMARDLAMMECKKLWASANNPIHWRVLEPGIRPAPASSWQRISLRVTQRAQHRDLHPLHALGGLPSHPLQYDAHYHQIPQDRSLDALEPPAWVVWLCAPSHYQHRPQRVRAGPTGIWLRCSLQKTASHTIL